MKRPPLTRIVRDLPRLVPFVGPEAQERARGKPFKLRLGANESVFGPSPRALRAMADAASENWKYSDPESHDLRAAIARHHGVALDNVVVGEGIDGLLGLAIKIASEPGSVVVTSNGAYPTFNFHVAAQGAELVKVPFRDDREDLEELLAAVISRRAGVLYVSNPDNPMGSWWDAAALDRLIEALPDGVLLLLDEAYCDTAPAGAVPAIDVGNAQVLRLRTFSKAYGLAGARIGYALGHADLIQHFEKVRNHYGINRVGQVGALEALLDQAYLREAVGRIAASRETIARIASDAGLRPLPSAANFVTIDCGADGAFAAAVLNELLARDVFARKPAVTPLDRCIRISCGCEEDMTVLADVLPRVVQDVRARGLQKNI
ncbi:MAG: pyridoxal phosphate-dependent aminotransferase [Hyphomicrobium sp.]|jgi:histidinol-phosphate aminotransferase|uniref:pyridoxal phosphate-dependent aminotransferase n=2 Tax=Hyphomicrobium TaxID=81 RepID=UPI0025C1E6DF|nr:pyridoxal phosphate-dependent aminotransferase [Hyphomicrobium sp.]MBX9862532.1 pyridoxal phosphate-dependent aminotransferase [Hyphomicrobium sp.]